MIKYRVEEKVYGDGTIRFTPQMIEVSHLDEKIKDDGDWKFVKRGLNSCATMAEAISEIDIHFSDYQASKVVTTVVYPITPGVKGNDKVK